MHKHFDKFLNVEALIRGVCPQLVVELGAGSGEHTKKLIPLCKELKARLLVISDGRSPGLEGVEWRRALSHLELRKLAAGTIDVAIIDTDHNSWTVDRELKLLMEKLGKGGLALLHDTTAFAESNGYMNHYGLGEPYLLETYQTDKRSYREAVMSFVGNGYNLLAETDQSCGAIALERS